MPELLTGVASPVDIPKMLEFWEKSLSASFSAAAEGNSLRKYIERNPFLCLVAEKDDEIVATVVCGVKQDRGFIHHIAVEQTYIGSGILKRLITEAFSNLIQRSCKRCHIFVHDASSNPVTKEIIEDIEWARAEGSEVFFHDLEYPFTG